MATLTEKTAMQQTKGTRGKIMKCCKTLLAAACALSVTGCATIVGDKDQGVTINSTPSEAAVVITDETGKKVHSGVTPATVHLQKADGSYFGGKTYLVTISKQGFEEKTITINSSANGWYIAGNLVFGGLLGWLVVDPLTGAMYNLSPDQIDASLGESVATTDDGDKELSLVLVEDVPEALLGEMKLIGSI